MKRYVSFIMLFLFIIISIFTYNYYQNKEIIIGESKGKEESKLSYNTMAIMLEEDDGTYVKSSTNTWPKEGYVFNEDKSKCEQGSKLSWNGSTIVLKTNKSEKCYIYFDKGFSVTVEVTGGFVDHSPKTVKSGNDVTFTLTAAEGYDLTKAKVTEGTCELSDNNATLTAKNVTSNMHCKVEILEKEPPLNKYLVTLASKVSGDGYLYYHDENLPDGAGDNSYRYSGNEPNNYVCLGTKTSTGGCNDNKNLYRIIGVIPVKVKGGNTQNLIKLIKSEYATKEELGGWGTSAYGDSSSALSLNSSYAKYARIKNKTNINGFYWSGSRSNSSNEWQNSTLFKILNNSDKGFLSKMGDWKDKVETVTWNIAGITNAEYGQPSKKAFIVEMNNSTMGEYPAAVKTVDDKVGLMYASDYGFASSKDNWQKSLFNDYREDPNRSTNWLYNAVYEWTITRRSDYYLNSLVVVDNGCLYGYRAYGGTDGTWGIRPTFYLKSTVKYVSGEGSYDKPIFLS